jgi:hypothetical protein
MIPKLFAAVAAAVLVASVEAAEAPVVDDHGFALACAGFMTTAGQEPPGSRIIADGVVDFLAMRVRGLGIGNAAIVSATEARIEFGSSPTKNGSGAHTVEGTIDRVSGETHVLVRSAEAPSPALITMALDCRLSPRR